MKLNAEERNTVELIRNLSRQNTSDINDFFKGLMLVTLMNYSEGESTIIPYFGKLKINYQGDEIKSEGRVAKLDVDFTPSPMLVRNLGQLEDVKDENCDTKITDVECIKDVMSDITSKLNEIMEQQ